MKRGFTFVEVMIGSALMVVVITGIYQGYLSAVKLASKRQSRDDRSSELIKAFQTLRREIQEAKTLQYPNEFDKEANWLLITNRQGCLVQFFYEPENKRVKREMISNYDKYCNEDYYGKLYLRETIEDVSRFVVKAPKPVAGREPTLVDVSMVFGDAIQSSPNVVGSVDPTGTTSTTTGPVAVNDTFYSSFELKASDKLWVPEL